jgi:hypothetical protein
MQPKEINSKDISLPVPRVDPRESVASIVEVKSLKALREAFCTYAQDQAMSNDKGSTLTKEEL